MEEIISYLNDLDISVLEMNEPTLKMVNQNIRPFITQLSNSKDTTDKIQKILEMSDKSILIDQSKKIKIDYMIYNGCGSKVLEIFIEKDAGHILMLYVKKNFKRVINDEYGTFVFRKMIEKNFFFNLKVEHIDFEKECVLNTLNVFLNKNFEFTEKEKKEEEKILKSKKSLISHIIDNYFDLEHIQDKKYSFFLENFVQAIDSDEAEKIYNKIEKNIKDLSECPYGNYMIQSLIGKYKSVEQIIEKIDLFTAHENVLFKILLRLQSEEKDTTVESLIIKHYKDLKSFLFSGDCINTRCIPVVKRLFMIKEHNMDVNDVFMNNFTSNSMKGNIECARFYLMGNDSPDKKEKFVKKMMDDCWGKKGEKLLVWMSRVCSYSTREKILRRLRKKKKTNLN